MNDFIRDKMRLDNGTIPLYGEILAGGTVSHRESVAFDQPRRLTFQQHWC